MNAVLGSIALQAGQPRGLQPLDFLPFVAIFFIFYFLLIRPQQRRQKDQDQMLSAIEKGDQVVTRGGLHGRVTGVTDDVLTVEIADRVRVKIARSGIESVSKKGGDA